MKTLLLALIGLAIALVSKASGRFMATVRKVDPQSARWTVAQHLHLIGRFLAVAGIAAGIFLLAFLAPSGWAWWIVPVGMTGLVIGNVCLGALAGSSESLGKFLGRARRWAEIDRLIRVKEQTRDALTRFLVIVLALALSASFGPTTHAEAACAIAIDASVSPNGRHLADAIDFLKDTIFNYLAAANCTSLVVLQIGGEPRFAPRAWLEVPPTDEPAGCSHVEPLPLPSEASIFGWSRNVSIGLKQEAVATCEHETALKHRELGPAREKFRHDLDTALSFPKRCTTSRVTQSIRYLARDPSFASIVVVSDLLDNPQTTPDGIVIPGSMSVVLIAVAPDPKYGSIPEVEARIRAWEQVPRVKVFTIDELRPSLWSELAAGR